MTQVVLILGATGRFGRNAALEFAKAGWQVRQFDRAHDTLKDAAQGADVIVNGWNPTYPDWAKQVPELHQRVIEVAKVSGATVIIPGNVYGFGAQASLPWSEKTPHLAANPLGRIRIEMENAYRHAEVRTIVLRAGDFIDTEPSGSWFDQIMIKSLHKGRFTYPGNPLVPHSWAYLPDLCRAAVALAEIRSDLLQFSDIPFSGYTLSGTEMAEILSGVMGRHVQLKQMQWWPLAVAHPVWPLARCLIEMRYLWNLPHSLDGTLLSELLSRFQATPVDQALAHAIPSSLLQQQVNPDQPVSARL